MKRTIKKVAVLGSGIMGSGIACHFANIGVPVVLLDIVPFDLTEEEKDNPAARNRIVNGALKKAVKAKLNPLYHKSFVNRIETGNFDDDLDKIKDCDLILEAIIERLDIKQSLFERVEQYRKPGSIVASNTSGIPIHMMTDGRSEDFNQHFLGLHFFNPPRYLRLLEVIPTELTDPEITSFMMHYGDLFLGKRTVECKDTPAFIANRVGIYALLKVLDEVKKLGLTVEETDKLTGPASGKPKTGTFRLSDLVGADTTLKVKQGMAANLPNDESNALFVEPSAIEATVEKGWFGDKTKQGFYKKTNERDEKGRKKILSLDLDTLEYRDKLPVKLASLAAVKMIDELPERLKVLYAFDDKGGELIRNTSQAIFAYVSNRIPEIADDLYQIDDAVKAGFAWDLGAFEQSDIIGVQKLYDDATAAGYQVADWVKEMLAAGHTTFYKVEGGNRLFYDIPTKSYKVIPGTEELIFLDYLRDTNVVWKNTGSSLFDLGDGVLGFEFQTKMNSIGGEVLEGLNSAIQKAEDEGWKGLVVGNNGPNFSAGANLALMLGLAVEQEWDELDYAIRAFQQSVARIRFSSIPVVVAPHGLTLGGGCEMTMHGDQVVAAAETYIGLVEVGVGLVPAGGGTKELTLRFSDAFEAGDVELNALQNRLMTIAQAKVATSGPEAIDFGLIKSGSVISVNLDRRLKDAKTEVLRLWNEGYVEPVPREDVNVLGQTGLGMVYSGIYAMYAADWISEHDMKVAKKVSWIMCGGDLTGRQKVSEQYLLDLEREAFLSLLGEQKTLQRMEHTLKTGKPLRN
ncbi:MAG: 3-hydroxyacyl-CoA dehydrogenase/enoyl-CoA hydratase family protein [Bacteroidota bacterium]